MKEVKLNMKENFKYQTIKKLVDQNGNKKHAAIILGLSGRQIDRLIKVYNEKWKSGFIHGNRNRKPVNCLPQQITKRRWYRYYNSYRKTGI